MSSRPDYRLDGTTVVVGPVTLDPDDLVALCQFDGGTMRLHRGELRMTRGGAVTLDSAHGRVKLRDTAALELLYDLQEYAQVVRFARHIVHTEGVVCIHVGHGRPVRLQHADAHAVAAALDGARAHLVEDAHGGVTELRWRQDGFTLQARSELACASTDLRDPLCAPLLAAFLRDDPRLPPTTPSRRSAARTKR